MSQKAELASLLTARNMLVAGKIVPANAAANSPLGQDAARARAIEWYLNTHHALQVLSPWFAGQANDPFAPGKKPEETARELHAALGLSANLARSAEIGVFDYYSDTPAVVSPTAASHVIGPVTFQIGPGLAQIPTQTVMVEGVGPIEFALANGALTVSLASGDRLIFDLAEATRKIETQGAPDAEDHSPIVLNASSGALAGTVLIDSAIGSYQEPEVKLSSVPFWLILNRPS